MNEEDYKQIMYELSKNMEINSMKSVLYRGRSLTIGTCGNGMVEVVIRGDDNLHLWVPLTTSEVSELIHSLAANIGCYVDISPRNDFLTNRPWKQINEQQALAAKKNIDE